MNVITNVKKLLGFFVIDGKGGSVSTRYFKNVRGRTHLRAIVQRQEGGGGAGFRLSEEVGQRFAYKGVGPGFP
jgi:hypothetical protein